jgi:molybdenum cofactor cytidylyltransferase
VYPLADGTPLGVAAARNLLAVLPDVVAVVRPGDFALAELLEQEGCYVTVCAQAASGMGASLAHGVAARRGAGGWLVALADMPSIGSATIAAIARGLEGGKNLVAPAYQGRRGHPVGFGKAYAAALSALGGDAGARELIAAHRDELTLIDCDDAGILRDIDTRADLAP